MNLRLNWDSLGIFTTVACAIHCMVLPVLFTSLPVLGINLLHSEVLEWAMIVLALSIGIYALKHGFTKHHKKFLPISLFIAGVLFLVTKQIFKQWEFYFLIPAMLLIVSAHYINFRMCRGSKKKAAVCCAHHKH